MEIKHIIFDFDGTLMDTAPVILATMAATIKEMGLPERNVEQCRATIGMRLEDIPAELFPEVPDISKEYAATYRRRENVTSGLNYPFRSFVTRFVLFAQDNRRFQFS